MDLTHRSYAPELMDDLSGAGPEWVKTLDELEFINRWLGGYNVTIEGVKKLLQGHEGEFSAARPLRIADYGCGGGDGLRELAQWTMQHQIPAALTGVDANSFIVDYAAIKSRAYPNISFKVGDVFDEENQEEYDIITFALFCHHFHEDDLVKLFRSAMRQARLGIVINDLHRHPVAYHAIKMLTKFFAKSPLIKHDAPLSVARGFSRQELEEILRRAGIENYTISWRWAWRWLVVISC